MAGAIFLCSRKPETTDGWRRVAEMSGAWGNVVVHNAIRRAINCLLSREYTIARVMTGFRIGSEWYGLSVAHAAIEAGVSPKNLAVCTSGGVDWINEVRSELERHGVSGAPVFSLELNLAEINCFADGVDC